MPSYREGLDAIYQEPSNRIVVSRFVRVAIAVAVAPVTVYFVTYAFVRNLPLPSHGIYSPPILAGFAAVLTLNGITAAFAVHAALEKLPSRNPDISSALSSSINHQVSSIATEDHITENTSENTSEDNQQDTTTTLRPKTE